MDEKTKVEKVIDKAVEYYFKGFNTNEAVLKAMDEINNEKVD